MATLREFILNQSTLPTGNTVRDHIQNPSSGGGDPYPVYYKEIKIEAADATYSVATPGERRIEAIQENISLNVPDEEIKLEID